MLGEIFALIKKELLLEWKQKYAFNGLLLYVLSMVVVIALAFRGDMEPLTWNIIYWIILLFVAINAVAKSFISARPGQLLYLYGIASPTAIIISKMVYNLLLLAITAYLSLFAYAFLTQVQIVHWGQLILITGLGCAALSANLTLVTAISARAENRNTLLAVLGFPLIIPILLLLIRLSRFAIEGDVAGTEMRSSYDQLAMLGGLTVVLAIISIILFPFVWRE